MKSLRSLSFLFTMVTFWFIKRSSVLMKMAVLAKQLEIAMRLIDKHELKYVTINEDRYFLYQITKTEKKTRKYFKIVSPDYVLRFWKDIQRKRYTFPSKKKIGRPRITNEIRKLIIEMKNQNYLWGNEKISGVFKSLKHDVSKDTVRRVIQQARRDGHIPPKGSWRRFLNLHMKSLFCCDFFTVETVFQSRFYVFFIMEMKSRKIVQYGVTKNPNMRFVRNQLLGFMFKRENKETYLIHDNSGELRHFDYFSVGIRGVSITPYSPNMNAHAERFVRSAKEECMDHFVVFNQIQLRNLMREYIKYYNTQRPHQGIDNNIPAPQNINATGVIKKKPAVFGLYHAYYREAV